MASDLDNRYGWTGSHAWAAGPPVPVYRYWPLPPIVEYGQTPPFTRIMLLRAGVGGEPLRCSLTIVNVESCPPFEALSYVWGQARAVHPVLCDGGAVSITQNLDDALRSLRLPTQARRLWVDAVCIDQQNLDERSRQVRYMRLIYSRATRVIVWLGLKVPGLEKAMDLAEMIHEIRSADRPDETTEAVSKVELNQNVSMLAIATLTAEEEAAKHLQALLFRDFFSRSWCVQEVLVSAYCVAKIEDVEIDFFKILSTALYIHMGLGKLVPDTPLEFWNMVYMKRTGNSRLVPQSSNAVEGSIGPLLHLLVGTRDFKATDPRDKIFALLGITDEGLNPQRAYQVMAPSDSLGMKLLQRMQGAITGVADYVNKLGPDMHFMRNKALIADYKKPVMEVYRDFTRFHFRKAPRILDILSHVQHIEDPSTAGWPSWVPKWFQPRSASMFGMIPVFLAGFCDGHFRYFAEVHDNPLGGNAIEPNSLKIDGFYVDRVRAISEVIQTDYTEAVPVVACWGQLLNHLPLFPCNNYYRNGEPLDVAFCSTLAGGILGPLMAKLLQGDETGNSLETIVSRFTQISIANTAAYLTREASFRGHPVGKEIVSLQSHAATVSAEDYETSVRSIAYGRRLYMTQNGTLGLGPRMMQEGDEVCVLFGGRVPFLMRRKPDHHLFIGESYLHDHDIMWGKVTEAIKRGRSPIPVTTFDIR